MIVQRFLVLAVSATGMLASFMPWITHPRDWKSGWALGDGKYTSALFLATFVVCMVTDKNESLRGGLRIVAVVPCIIAAVLGIQAFDKVENMGAIFAVFSGAETFSVGFGLYLAVVAGFLVPVVAFALRGER